MQDNDVYLTLPSNASSNLFPSNSKSNYRVMLSRIFTWKRRKIGKLVFIMQYIHYRGLTFLANAHIHISCFILQMISKCVPCQRACIELLWKQFSLVSEKKHVNIMQSTGFTAINSMQIYCLLLCALQHHLLRTINFSCRSISYA